MGEIERLTATYTKEETYTIDFPHPMSNVFQKWWYYHDGETWNSMTWMGIKLWKYPTDLWIYQQILFELQPDLIVETGTAYGGSALYLAHLCDLLGRGRVLTVDILVPPGHKLPDHGRITYATGLSTDPSVTELMPELSQPHKILTILDSDHSADHVLNELRLYAPLSDYLIVEDTNLNGHPVRPNFGPGPYEAVETFLASEAGAGWEHDEIRERFALTANPGGYLRQR